MPTYEKCPKSVENLAAEILCEYEDHKPLLDARVTVDYVFARCDKDEDGNPVEHAVAIKHHGVRALAVTRKTSLKQRALGNADAEITIDWDWWEEAGPAEQKALLDHELHHLEIKTNEDGDCKDDLGRPLLKLRPHDADYGWFKIIAERHGANSQEVRQARLLWDMHNQAFFPFLSEHHPVTA